MGGRLLLVVLFFVLLGATPASAQSSELLFVQPEKLAVNLSGGESDEATVWLKNASGATVTPSFTAALEDSEGAPVEARVDVVDPNGGEIQPPSLQAGEIGRYRVRLLEASESSGQLLATAAGISAAALPLSLKPKLNPTRRVDEVLIIPFGVALLLLIVAWFGGSGTTKMTGKLASVTELDFSKSFASTLTGVGALLGTIIAATGVLPEETSNLSKVGFAGLNLTFGIAIVIAAAIAASFQSSTPIWNKDGQKEWKVEGYVLPFLVAALVTLWAVFGELGAIWLLMEELGAEKGVTSLAVATMQILLVVAGVAMIPYTVVKVKLAVEEPEPSPPQPPGGGTLAGAPGGAGEASRRPIALL